MRVCLLTVAFLLWLPSAAQELPGPPPLWMDARPHATYAEALEARIQSLQPDLREPFFRRLREQQRDLRRQIEGAERDLDRCRGLAKDLRMERNPLQRDAEALLEAQTRILDGLRTIERAVLRLRAKYDPQTLDADELQVDLYGGFQFSSLYRDPNSNGGFFSKSRPFAALDTRQAFRRLGKDHWLEAYGNLSFQSSSIERSEALNIITTSGNFRAEIGLWWMKRLTERVSWGILGATGLVGFSAPVQEDGVMASAEGDHFRTRYRLGLTLRQEQGSLKGSFAEVGYQRDPLFIHQDRLLARGRVVLTQFGSQGASGDFYAEGFVNKGKAGRDEAVLLLGIRLSTVSFFRSLGGGQGSE